MSPSLFIKICGLRTAEDVDTAVEAGADAIGFVFADSPRQVDAATAGKLARRVPEHVLTVGVFRRQPVAQVRDLALASGVRSVQLHGDEGRDYYDTLRPQGWTLIRATSSADGRTPRCGELGEDYLLLDAPDPGAGLPWNWADDRFTPPTGRWLLAGGLDPENVRRAVRTIAPWGVDVSSGVEARRGIKDPALIREFIQAARSAE
ncbi:phosphoribosylanthranilate isomerase [Streptomyces syringium]|uniref:N-(5'-phosphoribosyl)anthranilate isomerase n=1 Tax=Streptomyces syringium TaxID=76729 RepID=A0ABS4Y0L4_9ACTN|nr:phosphoribosylanthranilate isomerase [Streptomyces syringium]MBP2402311.1 phosphoribosylanthranilate isomerase [Streptomyces syringium]SPE49208.1 N-(5'-phosphoribosyl)anthranilate isomerase [Streptomyces netropsis]